VAYQGNDPVNEMDVALCYESVLPARGGAETYLGDLARRLAKDGHRVHLYACRWDAAALPPATHFHRLDVPKGPRFLRPWRFAAACEKALSAANHDVTVGFDKTWGQDVLYPQGGLHAASQFHNRLKFPDPVSRLVATIGKWFDPAWHSFARLERKQYLGPNKPIVIVNSRMVQGHFERFYGIGTESVRVVPSAIDPGRFSADDRLKRRHTERDRWGVTPDEPAGLFVAMNYRLKGLAPLIRSLTAVPRTKRFRVAVVGHPKFGRYERLAQSLGVADRVLFLGHRSDPRDCYFAADFLAHPTFYDPCSLVVLEALACGLPVVTTRYNGASELLTVPDTGLVVNDPHDAAELGGAIERMLNPDYRRSAAPAARQAATRWTFEAHYRALLDVFAEVRAAKRAA
jgi:UDP-glucose:(heptosyl)LPS alpha-1,3-glucosyltransferase